MLSLLENDLNNISQIEKICLMIIRRQTISSGSDIETGNNLER